MKAQKLQFNVENTDTVYTDAKGWNEKEIKF